MFEAELESASAVIDGVDARAKSGGISSRKIPISLQISPFMRTRLPRFPWQREMSVICYIHDLFCLAYLLLGI
jgi:hypothetical protein